MLDIINDVNSEWRTSTSNRGGATNRVGQLKEPTNEPVSGRGLEEERNSPERKITTATT